AARGAGARPAPIAWRAEEYVSEATNNTPAYSTCELLGHMKVGPDNGFRDGFLIPAPSPTPRRSPHGPRPDQEPRSRRRRREHRSPALVGAVRRLAATPAHRKPQRHGAAPPRRPEHDHAPAR